MQIHLLSQNNIRNTLLTMAEWLWVRFVATHKTEQHHTATAHIAPDLMRSTLSTTCLWVTSDSVFSLPVDDSDRPITSYCHSATVRVILQI